MLRRFVVGSADVGVDTLEELAEEGEQILPESILALFCNGIFNLDIIVLGDVIFDDDGGRRAGSFDALDGDDGIDETTGTDSFVGSSLTNVP
jgi:hypothetical protein